MRSIFTILSISLLMICSSSCSSDPTAIEYGSDQCAYCKMNIVDRAHAAQYVTDKGKQFKFDAIECMIHQVDEVGEKGLATILVSDLDDPGRMTEARRATYLISKKIKSPMGAFLSAFSSADDAEKAKTEFTGDLYDWQSIRTQIMAE